jgi:hypothetical protein
MDNVFFGVYLEENAREFVILETPQYNCTLLGFGYILFKTM